MICKNLKYKSQPFPQEGQLADRANLSLGPLRQALVSDGGWGYRYIVATIKNKKGSFIQEGCAPNFQGGLITLCTCKHKMRTYKSSTDWSGVWIAGFSSVRAGGGRQALVYLMKVERAFDSHYDFWFSDLMMETKQSKAANIHPLGDVYQPRSRNIDKYNLKDYLPPYKNHVHGHDNNWHNDIVYHRYGRPSSLLVGNPDLSFLWNKPMLYSPPPIQAQGEKKYDLKELLNQLRED